MKKRLVFLVLIVSMVLTLAGCDWLATLFWPKVELADAQEAWQAFGAVFLAAAECTVPIDDDPSDNDVAFRNASSTLSYEERWDSAGTYDISTLTASGFTETTSSYTFDGTMIFTSTSTSFELEVDMDMDHDSKPVKHVEGTVTTTSSGTTGSMKFNNDEYDYVDFSAI